MAGEEKYQESEWKLENEALDELCKAYQEKTFVPILEADITGYLYYILVKRNNGDSSNIHISARIREKDGVRKYPDLVIGPVLQMSEQLKAYRSLVQSEKAKFPVSKEEALKAVNSKEFQGRLKPLTADIEIAVEIKPFLHGFSNQQLRHRQENAISDIKSLASIVKAKERVLLLFDEVNYLTRGTGTNSTEQINCDQRYSGHIDKNYLHKL